MTNQASPTLRLHRKLLLYALSCSILIAAARPALAAQSPGIITVKRISLTPHLRAYAQVEPVASIPVNAPETGVISHLTVVPGTRVHAGQTLATLTGPSIQNRLSQDQANLRAARIQLSAAKKSLAIQQQQMRAHLSTRQAVHQATSAVAKAQADLDDAQAQLSAAHRLAAISAPTDGIVSMINSSNGQFVTTGRPVLTLQPSHALWLRATYYGANIHAIHTGITGSFQPSSGSPAIPVRVRSIAGAIGSDGGESVYLEPLHTQAKWLSGEFGSVSLNLPPRKMTIVPTRALILSQGKWWVMLHTPKGDRPQQVVTGPAKGWNTYISSGLAPGSQVIVNNPYLLFQSVNTGH